MTQGFVNGVPQFAVNPLFPNTLIDVQTLVGNNTTVNVPIFRIVGVIEVYYLWAKVTTVLGSNLTACKFDLFDQTTSVAIASAGVTLSSLAVNSIFYVTSVGATSINSQSAATNPPLPRGSQASPQGPGGGMDIGSKVGANTDVRFIYTTTNTPTSGVIEFYLCWRNIDKTSTVTAL